MNWVDLVIILIFGLYVWDGYRRGFLRSMWELFGLGVAFLFALKFYPPLSNLLDNHFSLSDLYSKPIAFLAIWFIVQGIFYLTGRIISYYTPTFFKESKTNRYLGILPAAIKGFVFISVILILFLIMPLNMKFKNAINNSLIGGELIKTVAKIENQIAKVFTNDSGTSLSATVSEEGSTALNFSTTNIEISPQAEQEMLNMLNTEREKAGLQPLAENILVRNVARAQSRDMLIRGYFSHNSPTGQGLLERLTGAHVNFSEAAENIALAPTIDLASIALMNSPKHKANILDPSFNEVGIGVLDAGPYGLMVTEDFIR